MFYDATVPMVQVNDVVKCFQVGAAEITVLRGVSFAVSAGEFVSIVGPSGNGKSTLLNMVTGIDRPSSGDVVVVGQRLNRMSEDALAQWRGGHLGIVFQFFQMLPALTLLNNVILPMDLAGKYRPKERRERAMGLLEMVGLADQAHKLPGLVSGGEQQRAAVARALANDPPLLVADEPTGNLDRASRAIKCSTSSAGSSPMARPSSWSRTTRSWPPPCRAALRSRTAASPATTAHERDLGQGLVRSLA